MTCSCVISLGDGDVDGDGTTSPFFSRRSQLPKILSLIPPYRGARASDTLLFFARIGVNAVAVSDPKVISVTRRYPCQKNFIVKLQL